MVRKSMMTLVAMVAAAVFFGTLARAVVITGARAAEPADFYKAKCVACHGKKAEKKFDTSLTDDQLVEVVLKGKKAEKPPNMPSYEDKGVTAEQAKALVDYMKQLKTSP
jgi:mono/diheme cytochrome c family protein